MPTDNKLTMEMGIDFKSSVKSIKEFEQQYKKSMQKSQKTSENAYDDIGKAVQDYYKKANAGQKIWEKQSVKSNRLMERTENYIYKQRDALKLANAEIKKQNVLKKIGSNYADPKKLAKAQRHATQAKTNIDAGIKHRSASAKEYTEAAKKFGKIAIAPFKSFFNKDLPNLVGGSLKLAGTLFAKTAFAGKATKMASGLGDKLLDKAGNMNARGKAQKARTGKGPGMAMKGLEGLIRGLGGMLKQLPLVMGLVNASIVGLVKMFLDAQAVVKDINKDILASASTSSILASNYGDADKAASSLDKRLGKIADAALDFKSNSGFGISKEEHTAVLSSLQAEGVGLGTLEKQYGSLNKQTEAYSNSFGSITQMAVTYSRQMGVSLQEVTSLQGEMMTEMGSSLTEVQSSFHQMSEAAADSGIAGNKFFAMIRGVSADLNLYNNRIEDATKLLGALGKVMNPKNAQAFMVASQGAMHNMDRAQKLQISMLAGTDFVRSRVLESVGKDQAALAKAVKDAGGDADAANHAMDAKTDDAADSEMTALLAKMEENAKNGTDADREAFKAIRGTLQNGFDEFRTKKNESKGDDFAVAQAAGDTNGNTQMEIVSKAAQKFGGLGTLGGEMMAQQLGISHDEYKMQVNFGKAMERQRKLLKSMPREKQIEMLTKAGIKVDKDASKDQVDALVKNASFDTLQGTEDPATQEGQEATKKAMAEEAKATQQQGQNVQGIQKKLEMLVDFIMHEFYKVMVGIWDTLVNFVGGDDAAKEQLALAKVGNQALAKLVSGAKDTTEALSNLSSSDVAKAVYKEVNEGEGNIVKLIKEKSTLKPGSKEDQEQDAKIAAEGKKLEDARAAARVFGKQKKAAATFALNGPAAQTEAKQASAAAAQALAEYAGLHDTTQDAAAAAAYNTPDGATTPAQPTSIDLGNGYTMTPGSGGPGGATTPAQPTSIDLGNGYTMTPGSGGPGGALDKNIGSTAKDIAQIAKHSAPGQHSLSVHDWHAEQDRKDGPEASDTDEDMSDVLVKSYKLFKTRGIKIAGFVGDDAQKTIHDGVLDAANEALLNYYMLKDVGVDVVRKALNNGASSNGVMGASRGGADAVTKTGLGPDGKPLNALPAKASGGMVTGIQNGIASVTAAAGEGLTSIGRGESIVPSGGGGGNSVKVELSLKGDLGRIIDARAHNAISDARSREKFR